jgi:hypothetical protein
MPKSAFILTDRIYTANAIDETIKAFASLCEAEFTVRDDNTLLVKMSCPSQQVVDEFLNYALGLSARERLA